MYEQYRSSLKVKKESVGNESGFRIDQKPDQPDKNYQPSLKINNPMKLNNQNIQNNNSFIKA